MSFAAAITKMLQLLGEINPFDGPPDPEAAEGQVSQYNHNFYLDWANIIVVFCLASAVNIALLSVQLIIHSHTQFPTIFYFLVLAILFAFACFCANNFIHSSFPRVAAVLQRLGLFFGVTAFFISVTLSFPLWFKSTICFLYALFWFAIMICTYLCPKNEQQNGQTTT